MEYYGVRNCETGATEKLKNDFEYSFKITEKGRPIPDRIITGFASDCVVETIRFCGINVQPEITGLFHSQHKEVRTWILCIAESKKIPSEKQRKRCVALCIEHGGVLTKNQEVIIFGRKKPVDVLDSNFIEPCRKCGNKPAVHKSQKYKGYVYMGCSNCQEFSSSRKTAGLAIEEWNKKEIHERMKTKEFASEWGEKIAASFPVDRVAARVTQSHVGIRPLKLTRGTYAK